MKKITKGVLEDYVMEVGEFEKEHRKYGTFYATLSHIFTQEDIKMLSEEGIDATDFRGVEVILDGLWSDSGGFDGLSVSFYEVEEYEEYIPEVVIPAHYKTKTKKTKFTPEWS